jgi:tRNA nucleotidyltransferase (CCA-adding enzyme)
MKIHLPDKVTFIINELEDHGFEAYAVGGCVRDSILGKEPEDWDITTSAKPAEVKKIFRRTIDTGILHGTVTVLIDKEGYEVTTYRIDGEYEDNRHPKSVEFTTNLIEDLKRRDFTINAMAYNETAGIMDAFGGLKDIEQGIIRCVGSAADRFDEDALRILRAVRFSAQLGFQIEQETCKAAGEKAGNLRNVSAERIRVELNKLLLSNYPEKLLSAYEIGITKVILPEFDKMMETDQHNPHHIYSVGMHTMKAVEYVDNRVSIDLNTGNVKNNKNKAEAGNDLLTDVRRFNSKEKLILRWTMLLHDAAKPVSRSLGKDGYEHYYGHAEKSSEMSKQILRRLKFDNDTIDTVVRLVKWHDYKFILNPAGMRKSTNKIGQDIMDLLFEVKRADILAQNPDTWEGKLDKLNQAKQLFCEMKQKKECVSLKTLQVNGNDLIELGFRPGVLVGETLNHLLEQVLENPVLNDKQTLLNIAKNFINRL